MVSVEVICGDLVLTVAGLLSEIHVHVFFVYMCSCLIL
jgi:hypothetical protein